MKRFSMLLAAGIAVSIALLGACSSLSVQTPAQVAAKVCPLLQSEIGTLSQAGIFTGGAAVTLNEKIAPDVDAACAAGATVTQVNSVDLVGGRAVASRDRQDVEPFASRSGQGGAGDRHDQRHD
ncbi:hypothetical protein KTE71_30995 [Burkholderia multivorans]|uniref:hypothetical protein n=1 Tax=Burkholderia multivorans TaxID=87883 RepID=UPI001C27C24D|nr:hypothetical protein [Burkholderia multivorans]MBU9391919.1 hypothetical protein [Burkholderia multivorans]